MEALVWLVLARMAILVIPFRRMAPFLGQTMVETPFDASPQPTLPVQISWAVRTAGRHTPWESTCLARAMAAKMMLKGRGLPSTLYLGLAKNGVQDLNAHAWLRCGDRILTGSRTYRQFTVIATFGDQ